MKRHAQVRRATYTYGVIPQDIQLLHQLCDQDVLEGRQRDRVIHEWQPGGPRKAKQEKVLPLHLRPHNTPAGGSSRPQKVYGGS